ncbi:TadE family type IV pilus minor pilin [Enteractinococcus coprophilus]|uniref:TadE-like protein n=1 Tax=Enteractinococcus coprophilus TaxID=1027633 RepID=A0A543AM51_9MICC|nr:TadE family type IV pilus minor pilin [Enteractinococcus coprophilus]TQL73648.1 TadE-like protein [Enteractinococcus coprophilus]
MTAAKKSTAGSVTAEFAVILPVVVFVIAMLINIIAAGIHQSRLHQAAAVAARQLARGESTATITTSVTTMTTTTTQVSTSVSGQWASVDLTSPVPGPLGLLPTLELTAQAKAPNQWTVEP